jgi:hypothetical protein
MQWPLWKYGTQQKRILKLMMRGSAMKTLHIQMWKELSDTRAMYPVAEIMQTSMMSEAVSEIEKLAEAYVQEVWLLRFRSSEIQYNLDLPSVTRRECLNHKTPKERAMLAQLNTQFER